MKLTIKTAPSVEPVTIAEAKTHLRITASDDDTYIANLITAIREYIELRVRRALITQTWNLYLDGWPAGTSIELPRPPLQATGVSVTYTDVDGTDTVFAATNYDVDTDSEPGRIVLGYGISWPSATLRPMNPIDVEFKAGFGDASTSVPEIYRQAMLIAISDLYENRESIVLTGAVPQSIPTLDRLLAIDRIPRW
jgi:uncharacterized phiE125 gp8 family phage protein